MALYAVHSQVNLAYRLVPTLQIFNHEASTQYTVLMKICGVRSLQLSEQFLVW